MGNTNKSGLLMHDATAASYACAGRRGNTAAMQKARQLMKNGPEPVNQKFGSPNHHLIQASNNALIFIDYGLVETWSENALKYGIGEGGSLYFPSGNCGYVLPLIVAAEDDGKKWIAQDLREWVARVQEWMEPMALPKAPSRITSVLPSGEPTERPYVPRGDGGHIFFPGSRALYGHSGAGAGWYAEGPATVFYQWIAGIKGRTLPGRFAGFVPKNVEGTWNSWPWMTAVMMDWVPPKLDPQPKTMAQAFRDHVFEVNAAPGPYKLRFGMQVVSFLDGSVLCTCTHKTAAPKPPVVWVEYHAPTNSVRLCAPDGLRTYGSTGRGDIRIGGKEVWARGWTEDGVVKESRKYRVKDVVAHWIMPPKSGKPWAPGELSRGEPMPPPPPPDPDPEPTPDPEPPEDEAPPERGDSCKWYEYLMPWKWGKCL